MQSSGRWQTEMMGWSGLSTWWLSELASDPAYESVVTPLLVDMLQPERGMTYLDLGCGEGRVMRSLGTEGAIVHGLDISDVLASKAGLAFVAELPGIPVRYDVYDGVYCVLTLEHIADHERLFVEAARVTRGDGIFALVINHPVWTAPDSTPITDDDGEVLWRPGSYFSVGSSTLTAGTGTVVFHHRSMADLLNAAADAGWSLEHMIERPHHEFDDQSDIPRLLAVRWRLSS